jgi:hypothetical protein
MGALLLPALPSQVAAQLSAPGADWVVDSGGGCGVEFTEEPTLGCPRYESVVNDGPLSNDVVLSGARLLPDVGICGNDMGGAAIVEPMLLQPLLDWGVVGFTITLRSTGVTGVVEPQGDVGAAGVPEADPHGGGAKLLPLVELAGGVADCVVKGLVDCEGEPVVPNVCCAVVLMPLLAERTPVGTGDGFCGYCGEAYRLFGDAVIVGAVVGPVLDQLLWPAGLPVYRTGAVCDGGSASAVPANKAAIVSTNEVRWASIEIPL